MIVKGLTHQISPVSACEDSALTLDGEGMVEGEPDRWERATVGRDRKIHANHGKTLGKPLENHGKTMGKRMFTLW